MEVKVAPIECDLEQLVQRGDAAVAAHVQTPPNRRVDLEEQDVELVKFDRIVWLDHRDQDHLSPPVLSLRFFPVSLLPGERCLLTGEGLTAMNQANSIGIRADLAVPCRRVLAPDAR